MKRKKGVVEQSQRDENTVHFVFFLRTYAIFRIRNLQRSTKYSRAVWSFVETQRRTTLARAHVFTEQRSSASHMTAATVLDVVSRLLDCVGESSDAVSACAQVKMEHAPVSLRLPTSECPTISMSTMKNYICENVQ